MDAPNGKRRMLASLLLMTPGFIFSGYVALRRAGMAMLYKPAILPDEQIRRNIPYRDGSNDEKHQLDLFLPPGTGWPILVFIHGGALASGDKCLRVGGADVYGNIGRFYAGRGIGVAVINYRLQPKVTWREQVDDVVHAIAWVYSHLGKYGGDTSRLFLSGHSAGAHLAARVALDPRPLAQLGLSPGILSGVIAISGAGFDLSDTKTYELGAKLHMYEERFRCHPNEDWQKEASPICCAGPGAPPFLIVYAEGETKALQWQSQLMHRTLLEKQIPSELVEVPGQSHCRIVLTLSRPDKTSAPAILRFITKSNLPNGVLTGTSDRGTVADLIVLSQAGTLASG